MKIEWRHMLVAILKTFFKVVTCVFQNQKKRKSKVLLGTTNSSNIYFSLDLE